MQPWFSKAPLGKKSQQWESVLCRERKDRLHRSPEGGELQPFLLMVLGQSYAANSVQRKESPGAKTLSALQKTSYVHFFPMLYKTPSEALKNCNNDGAVTGRSLSRGLNTGLSGIPCWFFPHSLTCAFHCHIRFTLQGACCCQLGQVSSSS